MFFFNEKLAFRFSRHTLVLLWNSCAFTVTSINHDVYFSVERESVDVMMDDRLLYRIDAHIIQT